jgi:hypothetical protein
MELKPTPTKHVNLPSLFISLILGELLLTVALSSPLLYASSQGYISSKAESSFTPVFQKGMSYVSWPPRFDSNDSDESLRLLRLTNTEWVSICVFWYQDTVSSTRIYAPPDKTPTNESVVHAINRTHELSMKVMLKPMVDPLDGHWRGEIPPSDAWFQSYANFINFWADFSQEHGVEMLCIGCEFQQTESWTSSWENIIVGVRERYLGPLTYAAADYRNVEWWDSLDYVGIEAYFSLTDKNDPTLEELKQAWSMRADAIEMWQSTVQKPVIFTEIGYRSGDGANRRPEDYQTRLNVDLQEQADCYEAAFQTLLGRSWFYGFYWWNWETRPNAGGTKNSGFTPQNKPAEETIRKWYALPVFASLSKEEYSLKDEALLTLRVLSPNYSNTIKVQYEVSRDGSLVKNDSVEVQVLQGGVCSLPLGQYKAGDYTLSIAVMDPSTNQNIYETSMEFAVKLKLPIIPLIVCAAAAITIVLVIIKFKGRFRGLISAAARGMAKARER